MLSVEDVKNIVPANIHLDLPTRVSVVEFEFFKVKGNWAYQLKLCEQLHDMCVTAVTRATTHGNNNGVDEAMKLVTRMDALLLRGLKKAEHGDE